MINILGTVTGMELGGIDGEHGTLFRHRGLSEGVVVPILDT